MACKEVRAARQLCARGRGRESKGEPASLVGEQGQHLARDGVAGDATGLSTQPTFTPPWSGWNWSLTANKH